MMRSETSRERHIPGVLKVAIAVILLRWVVRMHHRGSGGPGGECFHRHWRGRERYLQAREAPRDSGGASSPVTNV